MKVLHISSDYTPDSGGIAAHVHHITRALANNGTDVTVVGGSTQSNSNGKIVSYRSDESFREIVVWRRGPRGIRGGIFFAATLNMLSRLSKESWDIVHFHNFLPDGLLAGIVDWPRARTRVMTNHSSGFLTDIDNGRTRRNRFLTRRVDGFIGPSKELCEKSHRIMRSGQIAEFIPNGVDTMFFTPGPDRGETRISIGAYAQSKIVLAARRHVHKNGLHYLLQTVKRVSAVHPDVLFCLAGTGEQTPLLKKLVHDDNVGEFVRFIGRKTQRELVELYRCAYVTVLPSLQEAVSLAGLESMACGCPVVGTDVGGIPEFVIPNQTGLLVRPQDPDDLAMALIEILSNPSDRNRIATNCSAFVNERFSWDAVSKMTIDFYNRLVSTH